MASNPGTDIQGDLTPSGKKPILNDIFEVSAHFLGQLLSYFEMNPPAIPISNIIGFQQFVINISLAGGGTTTSDTFADLGDTALILPDGKYLLLWMILASNGTAPGLALAGPSINGAGVDAATAAQVDSQNGQSGVSFTTATLNGGTNAVKLLYRRGNAVGTASFNTSRLLALRYANP